MIHHRIFARKELASLLMACALCAGAFMVSQTAHAASNVQDTSSLLQKLLQQIDQLRTQLKTHVGGGAVKSSVVQGIAPTHTYVRKDDGKTGKAKIALSQPAHRAVFDKQDPDDPIVVSWEVWNAPEDAIVEVEIDTKKAIGTIGGGTWEGELPEGDSAGTYEWEIYGAGRTDAGVYKVRAIVRTDESARKEKIYARTPWKTVTVVDDSEPEDTAPYKAVLNGRTIDRASAITEEEAEERCSDVYNDYDQYEFSGGDVLKCYWDGDKFETIDEWKG